MSNQSTILIVDNEQEILDLVKIGLNIEGFSVIESTFAKDALKKLKENANKINLILLDIMMEELDGIETLKIIRQNPDYNHIPVLMLTARPEDDSLQEAFNYGADDYITKPFTFDILIARIKKALNQYQKTHETEIEIQILNELKRNIELILENASFGVVFYSISGKLLFCNKYIKENFILEKSTNIDNLNISDLIKITCLPQPKLLNKNIEEKINYTHLLTNIKSEKLFFYTEEYQVIEENKILGIVQTFVDITEYKKVEEMLVHSDKLSSIGRLAASLAHEINNPLTLLSGLIQMMNTNKKMPKEFKEDINTMLDITNRIKNLIEKMLILSRKKPIIEDIKKIDIIELIQESIKLVDYKLKNSNIRIDCEYNPNDSFLANVSKWSILHCFVNILLNAIDASTNCGDKIIIKIQKENNYIIIEFIDFGIGIKESDKPNLFKPFFTTKPDGEGNGLGLYIVKSILDLYNAKIEINNAADHQGAEVIIKLKSAD